MTDDIKSFRDLGVSDKLLSAIEAMGYVDPTPIQEKAIPIVLMGRDVLGCAQTGTGKTASFTLPMIDILAGGRAKARMPRSIILEPTRELAAQVSENFVNYGKNHKLAHALLIGGESFVDQQKALDRGVDVLIATPGRLIDLFERGKILLQDVKILVIDEADRMLDMGFIPDVEKIVGMLPKIRQTLFFSATMPPEIRRLADKFLINPKEISVSPPASTALTIEDFAISVTPREKNRALRDAIDQEDVQSAIIFCNRKRDVDLLAKSLKRYGYKAAALHGDMTQDKRTETLDLYRKREIPILVASDVAARGLDVTDVSHVFNYDTPHHAEDYVHRIGRTGRAGKKGRAFTLVTKDDDKSLAAIEKLIKRKITSFELGKPQREEAREPEREPERKSEPAEKPVMEERKRGRRGASERPAPDEKKSRQKPSRERREDRIEELAADSWGDEIPAFLLRPARP